MPARADLYARGFQGIIMIRLSRRCDRVKNGR